MKKFMVSLIAVLATVGTSMAAETCNGGCKPKRHRVIYVSAHDPETMYGDAVYDTTVLSGDGSSSSQAVYQELALQPVRIEPANWYVGGRLSLHMLNWKNKYRATPDSDQLNKEFDHDDYTFEPLFGGGIFAGYHFGESWRGDAEFGYITRFTDYQHRIFWRTHIIIYTTVCTLVRDLVWRFRACRWIGHILFKIPGPRRQHHLWAVCRWGTNIICRTLSRLIFVIVLRDSWGQS